MASPKQNYIFKYIDAANKASHVCSTEHKATEFVNTHVNVVKQSWTEKQIFSQRKFFGKSSDPTTIYGASGVPGATLDVLSPFIFVQDKCC